MVIIIIPQLNNAKDGKKWNVSEFVRMVILLVLTINLSILIKMSTWKAQIIILEIIMLSN